MRRLDIGNAARRDIDAVLEASAARWGRAASARYRRLVELALSELRADPEQPGSAPAGVGDLRLYPLRFSARRLPADRAVRAPPHLLAYRFDADRVEIVAVLHERMDVPGRLGG